ncbi:MAG: hypothetical protein IT209_04190 [Armatimonadetes bacterium]|nr:hypothetical protein [Armatimonadota bacterium]
MNQTVIIAILFSVLLAIPASGVEAAQEPPNNPSTAEAAAWVKEHQPKQMPRKGIVPSGVMLMTNDPGGNPGDDWDDVGTWRTIREAYIDQTGCNTEHVGISWGATEKSAPVGGRHTYDFSGVRVSPRALRQKYIICKLDHMNSDWGNKLLFSQDSKDRQIYDQYLSAWAKAVAQYMNQKYGVTLFECGGNERDLVAESTFKPYFPNWYVFYMTPVRAIYNGVKAASPNNRLIAGNFCYTDRAHVSCMFLLDGKRYFDIYAIHAYGPQDAHIDMEQLVEARQELEARGAGDVPILVVEGWSSLPLPASIEQDRTWKGGARPYTEPEIEHFRQAVLDGWRNLTTERPGEYSLKNLAGANFFVLNDHWGGRGWAARGKAQYDDSGKLKGFLLDGYYIGTTDPDYLKPILRPWGLIDINGLPKGDTVYGFPPYLPKNNFTATLHVDLETSYYDSRHPEWTAPQVKAATTYRATVEFTNKEKTPMTDCHFSLSERSDKDSPGGYAFAFVQGQLHTTANPDERHLVQATLISPKPPTTVQPGQTVTLEYEVTFDPSLDAAPDGVQKRVRPIANLYYVWDGRPYHTDAWLPRVMVKK